ncbi:MAG TPA: hypothetical protein VF761_03670 [Gemmatimonadaceae bacterium]
MPRSRLAHASLIAALALLCPARSATQAPSLSAGALVRVRAAEGAATRRHAGYLAAIDRDSIVLRPLENGSSRSRIAIARDAVQSVEVGMPTRSHARRDMALGALIGTVAGIAIANQTQHDYACGSCDGARGLYRGTHNLGGAAIGLIVGMMAGGFVGAPRVHWTATTLPERSS